MNKILLLAEDDDDHYFLCQEAYQEAGLPYPMKRVRDGEELMEYLLRQGNYQNEKSEVALILLDLNMPKKDGREALREIKHKPQLQKIPIVILTTSKNEEDVMYANELGIMAFVRKPSSFSEFVEFMKSLSNLLI